MIILKVPITISTTKCIIFIFKKNRKKAEKAKNVKLNEPEIVVLCKNRKKSFCIQWKRFCSKSD